MSTAFIREDLLNQVLAATRAISQQINRDVLPVDLERLSKYLGYKIEEGAIKQQGYITTTRNGQRLIRIRQEDPVRVKRFTLAHEIGHIIWRKYIGEKPASTPIFRARDQTDEERIADCLAAELLMPMELFEKALDVYHHPSQNALRAMARTFSVSLTACIRRIIELSSYVAFTYVYDVPPKTTKAAPTFRIAYPRNDRLTFTESPISVVIKCLRHASATGRLWRGSLNVCLAGVCFEVPAFSEVVVGSRLTTVRVSGWTRVAPRDSENQAVNAS